MQDWPKTIVFSSFPFLSFGRTSITVTAREKKQQQVIIFYQLKLLKKFCQGGKSELQSAYYVCTINVILCKQTQKGKSLVYITYLNSTK